MNIIRLNELDDSFFAGLREGDFILVLGAGFSYGVPNKAGGTIPLGTKFAQITKDRFGLTYNPDYQSAAEVWETRISHEKDLLNEFKNLFLVDEDTFDATVYAPIFLPNWYNIFTLNFDNVLELTQQKTQNKQMKVFSYPEDNAESPNPDIFHLHGVIRN